jgi:glutamine amidotransferase
MIGIIDYGAGNIRSLYNAFQWIGCDAFVSDDPEVLRGADRLLLPGVGAFGDAIQAIRERALDEFLEEEVRKGGKPLLGICLGMQLLANRSSEHGFHEGLGYFDADVELLSLPPGMKIPHIGWNDIHSSGDVPFLQGMPAEQLNFYFVHSFHMVCHKADDVMCTCDYGSAFTAGVHRDNIVAVQFHPEKSQDNGIRFLENFLAWNP